jgi:hypothetical protein
VCRDRRQSSSVHAIRLLHMTWLHDLVSSAHACLICTYVCDACLYIRVHARSRNLIGLHVGDVLWSYEGCRRDQPSCRRGPTRAAASCQLGSTRAAVNLDLQVHRSLHRNCVKSPYLARQLSVFGDRQLATGLFGTIVQGASATAELDGERRDKDLY